ncbi:MULTISPECIES: type-F conjugative transfer system pilin assembly protein TrbC [Sphingobium]|uniref:Pilus assembly protein n=2 Tax=Sphingobium TaxID=165695 RepID=A0A0M3ALC0_9SPHN|nr:MULTISPECIES: type-F conjugative transfer system pilin assembly protein TrbC [Sphingobium]OAP30375.1 type-F conjugative transfer system pilin assembly protein TrbC [Sphingobium sp. 20006FA]KKW89344.1 pilus assembly protein [Sphingobium chungbukense]KXU30827.1 pilus assembly protein [Sphingobium sp. AM]KYC30654.1 pilus assembly protein [Sphingobium sp. 22B]MCB4858988.1 type-F conjugative transfer system pilin assembly protein TrbC [Sphingobium sp. PNB]
MHLARIGLAALFATAGLSALLAQTVEGIDVQAVKKRAADMQAEANAFVDEVKDRGDAFREEALSVHEYGTENMKRVAASDLPTGPAGPIDFDAIVEGAAQNLTAKPGEAPQFIAFASLSMPPASLKQMVRDTAAAGGIVVFRGFPGNSMKVFAGQLGKIVDEQDMANIGIDPRLFRAFDVAAVPTYVAVSSDFDVCAGFDCQTRVPPHDRMTGNVTVRYALSSFAEGHGPGAQVAGIALAHMDRAKP